MMLMLPKGHESFLDGDKPATQLAGFHANPCEVVSSSQWGRKKDIVKPNSTYYNFLVRNVHCGCWFRISRSKNESQLLLSGEDP